MRNWMEKRNRRRTAGCSRQSCLEAPLLGHGNVEVRVADPAWTDDEPGDVRPVCALGSIRPGGEIFRLKADERIASKFFGGALVLHGAFVTAADGITHGEGDTRVGHHVSILASGS